MREPSNGGRGGNGGSVVEEDEDGALAFSAMLADNHKAACSHMTDLDHPWRELLDMLRIAAATYLMVITAVNPLLCCCAPVCLVHVVPRPSIEKLAPVSCPNCCTHRQKCPRPVNSDYPVNPPPTRPDCPCRGERAQSVALPSVVQTAKLLLRIGHVDQPAGSVPFLVVDAVGTPCSPELDCGERRSHPFLTAADKLRALHILRC